METITLSKKTRTILYSIALAIVAISEVIFSLRFQFVRFSEALISREKYDFKSLIISVIVLLISLTLLYFVINKKNEEAIEKFLGISFIICSIANVVPFIMGIINNMNPDNERVITNSLFNIITIVAYLSIGIIIFVRKRNMIMVSSLLLVIANLFTPIPTKIHLLTIVWRTFSFGILIITLILLMISAKKKNSALFIALIVLSIIIAILTTSTTIGFSLIAITVYMFLYVGEEEKKIALTPQGMKMKTTGIIFMWISGLFTIISILNIAFDGSVQTFGILCALDAVFFSVGLVIYRIGLRQQIIEAIVSTPDREDIPEPTNSSATQVNDIASQLKIYKQMLDDGLITEEDYNNKKSNLLSK